MSEQEQGDKHECHGVKAMKQIRKYLCAHHPTDEDRNEAEFVVGLLVERDELKARFHTYNLIMADHAIAFKDMETQLTKAKEALRKLHDGYDEIEARRIIIKVLTELGDKELCECGKSKFNQLDACWSCATMGEFPREEDKEPCQTCKGSGALLVGKDPDPNYPMSMQGIPCPDCPEDKP